MCTKACRAALINTLPIIFAFWFAVQLMVTGSLYYTYINYLMLVYNLNVLFYMEFSATILGMIVCVATFVFIRHGLIGIIPLITFSILWIINVGLFLAQSILDYDFYMDNSISSLVIGAIDMAGQQEKTIPLMMGNYQIVNHCCVLLDGTWKWAPNTERVFSCCWSLIKCDTRDDWFPNGCLSNLVEDYKKPTHLMFRLNIVSVILLFLLFVIYVYKFIRNRRDKRRKARLQALIHKSKKSDEVPDSDHSERPVAPKMYFCLCRC